MVLSAVHVSTALSLGLAVGLCSSRGDMLGIAFRGEGDAPESPDLLATTVPGGASFTARTPDGEAFLALVAEVA